MLDEWKVYQLGDLCDEVAYGYTASADWKIDGPKFLRITDIQNYFVNWDTVPQCPIKANEHKKYKLEEGDIVIARTGATTGTTYTFKGNVDAVFASYLIKFKINKKLANPFYVGYTLKSNIWKEFVASIIGGSAQPGANAKQFSSFEVPLPDLKTQQQIVSILRSIDETIELNQQINNTLEEMAKAIFKEWFVDFNYPNAIGKFQETEIGKIPVGWKVYTFGDLIDTVSETYRFGKKEKIIFLNTGDILDGEFLHRDYSEIASLPGQAKKSIKRNDVLFSEIRPANKRFAFVNFDAEEYVVSTKLMVLRSKGINPRLVYFLLTREEMLKQLQHLAESRSGTFPQITFSQLKDLKVALPQDEALDSFVKILEAYYNQAELNIEENQSLINLRDTLLPKLMKGEIEINQSLAKV